MRERTVATRGGEGVMVGAWFMRQVSASTAVVFEGSSLASWGTKRRRGGVRIGGQSEAAHG